MRYIYTYYYSIHVKMRNIVNCWGISMVCVCISSNCRVEYKVQYACDLFVYVSEFYSTMIHEQRQTSTYKASVVIDENW